MATTQNTYTGDGSTTNYSFTFEYLKQADVKVTLDTAATTAFTFANATTLSFTTAPANGVAIRIYRDTDIDTLQATFFAGSAIKAEDLNNNFTQSNFAVQEADFNVDTANTTAASAVTTAGNAVTTANNAVTTANSAVTTANTATTTANSAVTTANSAVTSANSAVSTANTASTDATNAVNTANTASTNATNAVNTANSADTNATTALNNSRESDGSGGYISAVTKANTAITTANSAVTTANAASTDASAAVTTANTASTNATNAVNTANAASNAVSAAAFYTPIAALANLPSSPSNEDRVEVVNSTGVESNSSVSGVPSGFAGSTDLTVRLQYNSSTSKWEWQQYFAADPENRYLTESLPVVKGDSTNGSGQITLNCENNSHGIKIKGPPHSAAANYTLTLPNNTGSTGQALKTDGSGTLSFADVSSSFITQTDFAYAPTSNSLTFNDGLSGNPGSSASEFSFYTTGTNGYFSFTPHNASIKSNMEALQVGDSVTFDWTLTNGTTASQTTTVSSRTAQPIPSGSFGTVTFANSPAYHSNNVDTVKLTCSRISNGVEPIVNNQVLRYKTATSKWTVDTADASFIETPQAISVDKVIAASTNAGMMGPTVTINSGTLITVGANSQLTVLN